MILILQPLILQQHLFQTRPIPSKIPNLWFWPIIPVSDPSIRDQNIYSFDTMFHNQFNLIHIQVWSHSNDYKYQRNLTIKTYDNAIKFLKPVKSFIQLYNWCEKDTFVGSFKLFIQHPVKYVGDVWTQWMAYTWIHIIFCYLEKKETIY